MAARVNRHRGSTMHSSAWQHYGQYSAGSLPGRNSPRRLVVATRRPKDLRALARIAFTYSITADCIARGGNTGSPVVILLVRKLGEPPARGSRTHCFSVIVPSYLGASPVSDDRAIARSLFRKAANCCGLLLAASAPSRAKARSSRGVDDGDEPFFGWATIGRGGSRAREAVHASRRSREAGFGPSEYPRRWCVRTRLASARRRFA